MTNHEHYTKERKKKQAERAKAMKCLTAKQLQAIFKTHSTLRDAISMITECQDLYLSDIRKLEQCFWDIQNEFNLEKD